MSPLTFGTDGVRAAADALTDAEVRALGRAAAEVLGATTLLIGRDTRESGPRLEAALAAGVIDAGGAVEFVGVLPTPALAYVSQARAVPAAMISASHNVFSDNGIKFFGPSGRKLADDVESTIEARLAEAAGGSGPAALPGPSPQAHGEYVDHLEAALEGRRLDGLRVVIDCANGAAFEVAPEVLRRVGADVEVLAASPDGRNINEGCGSTHPDGLRATVRELNADVGLAFDGDADRLIAVDERGGLVDGDHFLAIAALDLRERGRLAGDTLVTTVMANLGLRQAMADRDIDVVETKVGDRYVLEAMEAGGYSLGGEQSGHVIFADLATTGDGVLSGLVLLDVMHRTERSLSALAGVVTKLPQVLENVRVDDRAGLDDADAFWADVRAAESELGSEGRVLVRPSGTEPVVRVMVEAPTEDAARRVADRLAATLAAELGAPSAVTGRR